MSELEAFAEQVQPTVETTAESQEAGETVETKPVETETGEQEAAPPAAEQTQEQTMVPLAAKQAEKERRIRAERELEALQAKANQNQEKIDLFDNPEQVLSNLQMQTRAEISEALCKREHDDYDTVMDHYENMAKENPAIHAQVMQDPLSAFKAYEMAKNDLELKEIGDISSYRQKLEAQIRAEIAAEGKTAVPPDMTTARSASVSEADSIIDLDKTDLNALLGR